MSGSVWRLSLTSALLLLWAQPSFAQVAFENTSTYRGNGRWDWKIFVRADRQTLARIDCVEYTLHPTFPDAVQRVCGAQSTNFAMESNGWGTFSIAIRVIYNDKRTESYKHQLVFTQARAATSVELTAENWSNQIEPGWWEWGIRIKGQPAALDRIRCVEYTLHRSFPNPVRAVCTRQNNFELKTNGWGTFTIPIKVLFKDNTTLELSHELSFTR
jgi:transcription initiation factor IIF auxiliary subunit